jgi:hypothetical protein
MPTKRFLVSSTNALAGRDAHGTWERTNAFLYPRNASNMKDAKGVAAQWARLQQHFAHHTDLVNRFRPWGHSAVASMWQAQKNEFGERLSELEREALIERHCELFGCWPT